MTETHDDLLTVAEVATWLKVDPRYVYRMASSGSLERVYVGRYLRIPESSVRDYIEAHTVAAVASSARRPGGRARRHLRAVRHAER